MPHIPYQTRGFDLRGVTLIIRNVTHARPVFGDSPFLFPAQAQISTDNLHENERIQGFHCPHNWTIGKDSAGVARRHAKQS